MAAQVELADKLYAESLELFRALGDRLHVGELIHRQATRAFAERRINDARQMLEESLQIALEVGNRWGECQCLGTMAHVARVDGDMSRAAELFERSAAIAVELGNVWWEVNALSNLTELDILLGRIDDAERRARRATALSRDHGMSYNASWLLLYLARIGFERGEVDLAGLLFGAAEVERAKYPERHDPDWDEMVAPLHSLHGDQFERSYAAGRRLSVEEALELGLASK